MRPSRRRRGPLTFETARREAEEAVDRDALLDLYFDFSRQFFDYAALFLVQADIAEGRDAFGAGAARERVLGIGVPLDMPSVLSTAREKRVPVVSHAAAEGLDAVLLGDLQRPPEVEMAAVPLVVRTRAVALLVGDCAESGVDRDAVQQVLACARFVGKSFERIIMRRKLEGFVAGNRASPEGRADAAGSDPPAAGPVAPAAVAIASSGSSTTATAPSGGVGPVVSPSGTLGATASPPGARSPRPAEALGRGSSESFVGPEQGSIPVASRSPTTLRGPYQAQPGLPPPLVNIASVRPVARPALPREEIELPADVPADAAAVRPTADRAPRGPENPQPTADRAPRRRETPPFPGMPPDSVPRRREIPAYPATGPGALPAAAIAAQRAAFRDDSDDSFSASFDSHVVARSEPPGQEPFATDSEPGWPGADLGPSNGDASPPHSGVVVPPHHPATSRAVHEGALPSVIIDLEGDFGAVVDRIVRGEADEAAEAELLRLGERAMPAVIKRFPGPVSLERARLASMSHPPRASECGPVLRLVARERRAALPFVLDRLTSSDVEVRGWATCLLAELPYIEAIPLLLERLRDDDPSIPVAAARAIAAIARSHSDAVAEALKQLARSSSSPSRAAAARTMAEVRDAWVVPELIAGLRDAADDVATAARESLAVVTRQDFGKDPRPWLRWWDQNGRRHRIEWLIDSLTHDMSEVRRAAGEELRALSRQYFGYASELPSRDRERAQQRYRDWWITEGRARQRHF